MSLSHSVSSTRSFSLSRARAVSVRASTPARSAHVRTRTRTRTRTPIPKDEIEFRANRDNGRGEKEHEPYLPALIHPRPLPPLLVSSFLLLLTFHSLPPCRLELHFPHIFTRLFVNRILDSEIQIHSRCFLRSICISRKEVREGRRAEWNDIVPFESSL